MLSFLTSFLRGQLRTLSMDEWLDQIHCTKLVDTTMENGEKFYIVDDCSPCDKMSELEKAELRKALDIKFATKSTSLTPTISREMLKRKIDNDGLPD